MALQDLTLAEMAEITSHWITPPSNLPSGEPVPTVRPLLEKDDLLERMIGRLEEVQQEIITFEKKAKPPPPPQVVEIEEEQDAVDDRHDTINRFLYEFKGILADLLKSTPFAEALLKLRGETYPLKLTVNKLNFDRQSGAARLVEGKLSDQDKALLGSISITADGQTFTLLELTDERITKAKRLVALEALKKKLVKEGIPIATPGSSTEYAIAQKWVNRVLTLERIVAMSTALTDEEKEEILRKRYEMEEAAVLRRKAKEAADSLP